MYDKLFVDVCFVKQPATQHRIVSRNDVVQLSSDIESSSVTDDSDADMITANQYNSHNNATRSALEYS